MTELTVLQTAEVLREESDRRIGDRIRALPQGGAEIRCRAGCFACCHQLVVVSPLEAHAIAEYVQAHPELREALRGRVEAWRARLAAEPELAEHLEEFEKEEGYVSGEQGGALETEYFLARIPCPFLDEGRCSIYPVRPFGCREHFVLSDPALCAQDLQAPETAGTRMEYRAVGNWVGTACFDLPDRLVLLPRALEYAFEHSAEVERGAAEERVRAGIAESQRRTRLALALLRITGRKP
jgi:Fe-S-cluster containining protein